MKILHLVAGGVNGGAGRGAYTLHLELLKLGVNSVILTDYFDGSLNENEVVSIIKNPFFYYQKKIKSRIFNLLKLIYFKRQKLLFSTGFDGFDITKHSLYHDADIIHLHWINGLVNIKSLKKINKPVIWTIRDMWPLTGGCHFGMIEKKACTKFESGCGKCILLNSKNRFDLSYFILQNKIKHLPDNIEIVGISSWISNCIRNSLIFKNKPIHTISNNININNFSPTNKQTARNLLQIDSKNKKIILFGGLDASLFHKGFDSFLELLSLIQKDKYYFLFYGNIDTRYFDKFKIFSKNFGLIKDDQILSTIYSSADVFISPSYLDSFGKSIAEAMSCETPVLCFDSTGPSDIVEHLVSGYKARAFDSEDLLIGLNWITTLDKLEYNKLCKNARHRILNNFNSKKIAIEYISLYKTKIKF